MSNDIFSGEPLSDPSDEHVLQNALGGRLTHPWLERALNSALGDTIDAALSRFVQVPRVLLNARSGDGQEPGPLKNAETAEGTKYNLLPGGVPELGRPSVVVREKDGSIEIEATVRSHRELRQQLTRVLNKHGIDFEAIKGGAVAMSSPIEPVRVSLELNEDVRRAMMKSLCNLVAVHDRSLFEDAAFNRARAFVLNAVRGPDVNVLPLDSPFDVYKRGRGLGPLDHVLIVRGDGATGEVDGVFTVFRHIQFFVTLGRLATPRSFATTYRVDQLGRVASHNDARDMSLFLPNRDRILRASPHARLQGYRGGVERLLRALQGDANDIRSSKCAETSWIDEMVTAVMKSTWQDMGLGDGATILPAHSEELSRRIAERFVEEVQARGLWHRLRIPGPRS